MLNKQNIGQLPSITDKNLRNDLSTQNIAGKRNVFFFVFKMTDLTSSKRGENQGDKQMGSCTKFTNKLSSIRRSANGARHNK
jgi:hypothetical protein